MKILLTTGIFPPDIGGPATYVPAMANALRHRGHDVRVLTIADRRAPSRTASRTYGFPVTIIRRGLPYPARAAAFVAAAVREARGADLLFGCGMFSETAAAARLVGNPLALRLVGDEAWERSIRRGWTTDGFDQFQSRRQGLRAELAKASRRRYARRADLVIVPSRFLSGVVTAWGADDSAVRVIYNAIERPEPERTEGSGPSAGLRILTVARLVPWKRVDLLVRAIRELPDATLTVAGDGPCRREWERLSTDLGVADRVRFLGALDRGGVNRLLGNHDIFALSSTYEGLPHVVVEAMAAGLPVVATAAGGTPEIVEHEVSGLLVSPDYSEIAEAFRRLERDPDLRDRLVCGGAQRIRGAFSLDVMVDQTEEALQRAVAER